MSLSPEYIQKIREQLDLTQNEFSVVMGCSPSTVYRWENGSVNPDNRTRSYLYAIDELIFQGKLDLLRKKLKKAVLVGGNLAAVYALLTLFFEEDEVTSQ